MKEHLKKIYGMDLGIYQNNLEYCIIKILKYTKENGREIKYVERVGFKIFI